KAPSWPCTRASWTAAPRRWTWPWCPTRAPTAWLAWPGRSPSTSSTAATTTPSTTNSPKSEPARPALFGGQFHFLEQVRRRVDLGQQPAQVAHVDVDRALVARVVHPA